jgi:hypothetical protein
MCSYNAFNSSSLAMAASGMMTSHSLPSSLWITKRMASNAARTVRFDAVAVGAREFEHQRRRRCRTDDRRDGRWASVMSGVRVENQIVFAWRGGVATKCSTKIALNGNAHRT